MGYDVHSNSAVSYANLSQPLYGSLQQSSTRYEVPLQTTPGSNNIKNPPVSYPYQPVPPPSVSNQNMNIFNPATDCDVISLSADSSAIL